MRKPFAVGASFDERFLFFGMQADNSSMWQEVVYFDFQVNGFGGVDFQQDNLTLKSLQTAVTALMAHRTERIFLTLITDDPAKLTARLENIESLRRQDPLIAEVICGYHLEGPYLAPQEGYRGAHPQEHMRAPDLSEFRRMQRAAGGNIRLVTLAPEWSGSDAFIAAVTSEGVAVSIGHSNADDGAIDRAIRAGARFCTHLGNGVPLTLPRHDNILQRLLARDELIACMIPDGIHLPPFVLKNYYRIKNMSHVLFTTDCMAAAGAGPGRYTLGNIKMEVRSDRVVRLPGTSLLAGSALCMDEIPANLQSWLGIPAKDAHALCSTRAAAAFGISMPQSILT